MKETSLLIFGLLTITLCHGQSGYVILQDQSIIDELISVYKIVPSSSVVSDLSDAEFKVVKKASQEYVEDFNKNICERFGERGERKRLIKSHQIKNMRNYKVQYIPYVNESGEKEIWINGFCQDFGYDWRKKIIYALDGGNCFFTIRLNLTTGERLGIGINGVA